MAVHAVFPYRSMLPQERASLFRVAGVAKLIDGVGLQQLLGGTAMRVMAIHTGHLALGDRHVRLLAELRALLLVAALAGFGDAGFFHQAGRREACHGVMAVRASELVGCMDGSGPVDPLAARVTIQALAGLLLDGRIPLLGETNDFGLVLGVQYVQRTIAVAGLAY